MLRLNLKKIILMIIKLVYSDDDDENVDSPKRRKKEKVTRVNLKVFLPEKYFDVFRHLFFIIHI